MNNIDSLLGNVSPFGVPTQHLFGRERATPASQCTGKISSAFGKENC